MNSKLEMNKITMSEKSDKLNKNLIRVIKGSITSIIISLILLLIYAALLTYTNISETTMVPVIITISGISILIGSSMISIKIKEQGMLNGALVGLIYMIMIYLISSMIFTGFSLNIHSIIMIIIGALAGIIGGVIGVNL